MVSRCRPELLSTSHRGPSFTLPYWLHHFWLILSPPQSTSSRNYPRKSAWEANFWDLSCLSENSIILPLLLTDSLARCKIPNWKLFSTTFGRYSSISSKFHYYSWEVRHHQPASWVVVCDLLFSLLKLLGKFYFIHRLYQICLRTGLFSLIVLGTQCTLFTWKLVSFIVGKLFYITLLQFSPLHFLSKTLISHILNFLNRAYFLSCLLSLSFDSIFRTVPSTLQFFDFQFWIFNFCYYIFNFQALFCEWNNLSNLSKMIRYNFGNFCSPCFSLCFSWTFCPDDLFWPHSFMTLRTVVTLGSSLWDLHS